MKYRANMNYYPFHWIVSSAFLDAPKLLSSHFSIFFLLVLASVHFVCRKCNGKLLSHPLFALTSHIQNGTTVAMTGWNQWIFLYLILGFSFSFCLRNSVMFCHHYHVLHNIQYWTVYCIPLLIMVKRVALDAFFLPFHRHFHLSFSPLQGLIVQLKDFVSYRIVTGIPLLVLLYVWHQIPKFGLSFLNTDRNCSIAKRKIKKSLLTTMDCERERR